MQYQGKYFPGNFCNVIDSPSPFLRYFLFGLDFADYDMHSIDDSKFENLCGYVVTACDLLFFYFFCGNASSSNSEG